MHTLDSPFVSDQLAARRVALNAAPERASGAYVLYWMQSTHRFEDNWALRQATLTADRARRPLLIYQGLDPTYEHANDRIHSWILENARELSERAESLGLTYRFGLRRQRHDNRRVVDNIASRAVTVITDAFPTAGIAERSRRFAERTDVRVVAVDSHGLLPASSFEKEEWAARTIRPKILRVRDHALEPVLDRAPAVAFPAALLTSLEFDALDVARIDIDAEVARCEIDHSVPPVRTMPSGRRAGLARLAQFVDQALPDYAERRSDPTDPDGSSRLSAYLHFGQLSAGEVARAVLATGRTEAVEKFLDELLTWRELSLNMCHKNPRFGTLHALPPWIHETMRKHVGDEREALYTREQLERAETHEPLWNAAQRELVATGSVHNVMRMYWGKSVLTWTATYSEALAHLIHLNNKWALDGRDPSSYGGIQWCFGKFDRPWGERPVWGTIRSRSLQRAYKKFDAKGYETRWNGDAQGALGM